MNYCDEEIRKLCGIEICMVAEGTMQPRLKVSINDKSIFIALTTFPWNSEEILNSIIDKEIGHLPELKRNIRKAKLNEIYSRTSK